MGGQRRAFRTRTTSETIMTVFANMRTCSDVVKKLRRDGAMLFTYSAKLLIAWHSHTEACSGRACSISWELAVCFVGDHADEVAIESSVIDASSLLQLACTECFLPIHLTNVRTYKWKDM